MTVATTASQTDRRPWLVPLAVAVVGWAALVAVDRGGWNPADHRRHPPLVVTMTLAMMTPLALPACHRAAAATRRWRVGASVTGALTGFVLVWVVAAAVLHVVIDVAVETFSVLVVALATAGVAIAGQVDIRRRARYLTACEVGGAVRPDREFSDAAAIGIRSAMRCLVTCVPIMALVAVRPTVAVTALVAATVLGERVGRPRFPRVVAVTYGVSVTIVALCVQS